MVQNAMKPKLDWLLNKLENIQAQRPRPLPDNVNVMLAVIYDFIRVQRNDVGHPQDSPPQLTREEVFVNLRVFPTYYATAQDVIDYLASNKV